MFIHAIRRTNDSGIFSHENVFRLTYQGFEFRQLS